MDHIFLPRKLNLVKLRKCQCMEIRLTSYWSRKEKRMIEITMDEWEKMQERAELKKVVDKTIKSIANEIQEKDIMPGQYPDAIRALAELVTARAALF